MMGYYTQEELRDLGLRSVGENVLLSRMASIYGPENITIGDNVRIDDFCILSGNITLHSYIHIAPYCGLFGGIFGIEIQDFSSLSSRCAVYALSDDYTGEAMTNPMIPDKYRNVSGGRVMLERHVIVGTGTTILSGAILREGVAVGSMSLVNKSLEAWSMYVGCPCRKLREREKTPLELEQVFISEALSGKPIERRRCCHKV